MAAQHRHRDGRWSGEEKIWWSMVIRWWYVWCNKRGKPLISPLIVGYNRATKFEILHIMPLLLQNSSLFYHRLSNFSPLSLMAMSMVHEHRDIRWWSIHRTSLSNLKTHFNPKFSWKIFCLFLAFMSLFSLHDLLFALVYEESVAFTTFRRTLNGDLRRKKRRKQKLPFAFGLVFLSCHRKCLNMLKMLIAISILLQNIFEMDPHIRKEVSLDAKGKLINLR